MRGEREGGREGGVERERKKTRGGVAQGNGESRLRRGRGTERDTMANGILLFQMAIAVSPSLLEGMLPREIILQYLLTTILLFSIYMYIYISYTSIYSRNYCRRERKP